jgi:predicted AAA+ superfamily ATPase
VLEGTFNQSEFAADISLVACGKASAEYQDTEKFFAWTMHIPVKCRHSL